MDTQDASLEHASTSVFHCATILVSAALVAFPSLRSLPASKVAILLMTVGMIVVGVRRESRRRTLGLTIPQIYAQAKRGRRFAPSAVELAAVVVWTWATMVTL